MRIKCIACDVLARPVYQSAARSPHTIDVVLNRFGLHITPLKLRDSLQEQIDNADKAGIYEAVVLAYGLCGKAAHGLQAGSIPLVIPRAHDCITLFLGGRDCYNREFTNCPGSYWFVQDFIERGDTGDMPLSIGAFTAADTDTLYAEFLDKYGADNANYLMEVMGDWRTHYERAVYIDLGVGDGNAAVQRACDDAQSHGWRFEQLTGDLVLINRLLSGDWETDFLILKPGQTVEMSGTDEIIQAG